MQTNVQLEGIHDFKKARLSFGISQTFRLGSFDLSHVSIGFAPLNVPTVEFSRPFGGIIGTEVLWTYFAIIDLGHRALYLHGKTPAP